VPAATVRPPSRTAKPCPTSSATGLPSSTVISRVSPGMTIGVSPMSMPPDTSVVRKKNCGR
jgi:hypothetical protein